MNLELLWHTTEERGRQVDLAHALMEKRMDKMDQRMDKRMDQLMTAVEKVVGIVEAHERRLEGPEGGLA